MARKLLFDPLKRQVLVDCILVKIHAQGGGDKKLRCSMCLSQTFLQY